MPSVTGRSKTLKDVVKTSNLHFKSPIKSFNVPTKIKLKIRILTAVMNECEILFSNHLIEYQFENICFRNENNSFEIQNIGTNYILNSGNLKS